MSWFSRFWKNVIRPIFRSTTRAVVDAYLPMAVEAVIAVSADKGLLTNDDRRSAFANQLRDKAVASGWTILTGSVLNLLRELALETAKAQGKV